MDERRADAPGTTDGLADLFPPLGLVITSGDLTMRLLRDDDMPEYAALVSRPVFEDEAADHVFPWYQAPPQERAREGVRFQWHLRAGVTPERWNLSFGVFHRGELIGMQDVNATEFARRRTVGSGSWLTADAHGRGHGSRMRRMMLAFAFDHLGAQRAESAAIIGNERSCRVSRACGYADNGTAVVVEGEKVLTHQAFVVTPETFVRKDVTVQVDGLTTDLRAMLGAEDPQETPA